MKNTSFKDRVLIANPKVRRLLWNYSTKGLSDSDYLDMKAGLLETVPSIVPVLEMASLCPGKDMLCKPSPEWKKFLQSLSSSSPVSALLHSNKRVSELIGCLESTEDITVNPVAMQILQEEIPILFELIVALKYYPKRTITPLLVVMSEKSDIRTVDTPAPVTPNDTIKEDSIAHFPILAKVRSHRQYAADRKKRSEYICTKHSSRHPSLLPGVFTVFCHHGQSTYYLCRQYHFITHFHLQEFAMGSR